MRSSPLRWFPPTDLSKFPHLVGGDVAVWRAFLGRGVERYSRFAYDVRVGEGVNVSGLSPENARIATALTQKRIDVVGERDGLVYDVIEVKLSAGLGAVGQLLGYQVLFPQSFPELPLGRVILVAASVDRDTQSVLTAHDVDVVVVGVDSSFLQ